MADIGVAAVEPPAPLLDRTEAKAASGQRAAGFRCSGREYRVVVGQPAIDPDAFNAFEARGWEDKAAGYDRFFAGIRTAAALFAHHAESD